MEWIKNSRPTEPIQLIQTNVSQPMLSGWALDAAVRKEEKEDKYQRPRQKTFKIKAEPNWSRMHNQIRG